MEYHHRIGQFTPVKKQWSILTAVEVDSTGEDPSTWTLTPVYEALHPAREYGRRTIYIVSRSILCADLVYSLSKFAVVTLSRLKSPLL